LALKIKDTLEEKKIIYHRIDLLRIEEGFDKLIKIKSEEFLVGFDNNTNSYDYQEQIEILN